MSIITSFEALEAIYGRPLDTSTVKEVDWITPQYQAYIDAAPFAVLATGGPEGLDCSPRGDLAGFVRVHDPRTVMMPDRRGNNRIDSLRNIVRDPRTSLLFLVPGVGNTLRVNGRAHVSIDRDLLASFAVDGKAPRSVKTVSAARPMIRNGRNAPRQRCGSNSREAPHPARSARHPLPRERGDAHQFPLSLGRGRDPRIAREGEGRGTRYVATRISPAATQTRTPCR